jgi:hypothetical protein
LPPPVWYYCVISCQSFRIVYEGQDREKAEAATNYDTFLGEGLTMGEAQRRAALGAGKKRQSRRTPPKKDP